MKGLADKFMSRTASEPKEVYYRYHYPEFSRQTCFDADTHEIVKETDMDE